MFVIGQLRRKQTALLVRLRKPSFTVTTAYLYIGVSCVYRRIIKIATWCEKSQCNTDGTELRDSVSCAHINMNTAAPYEERLLFGDHEW